MNLTIYNKNKLTMYERCSHVDCNKKLKLTDMSFHIDKIFCGLHRHAKTHNYTVECLMAIKAS